MQIKLRAEELPKDLAQCMVNSRVTCTVTFNVDLLHLHGGDMPHQEISGAVVSMDVQSVSGEGGVDPFIENSRKELQSLFRTMGTNA